MIIHFIILLAILINSAIAQFVLHLKFDNLTVSEGGSILCGRGECRYFLKPCLLLPTSSSHSSCWQGAKLLYKPGAPRKIVLDKPVPGCSPGAVCLALDRKETPIILKLNATIYGNGQFHIYQTRFQHILASSDLRPSIQYGRSEVIRSMEDRILTELSISTMITCSKDTYGSKCQSKCEHPRRVYYDCRVNGDRLCYLQPIRYDGSCQAECSSNLSCTFPNQVRIAPPTQPPSTTITAADSTTTDVSSDSQPTPIPIVRSARISTPHGSAAFYTFAVGLPLITLVIIACPFILHFCDPRRRALTEEKMRQLKTMHEERDRRWALPPGLYGEQSEGDEDEKEDDDEAIGDGESVVICARKDSDIGETEL